eukprot:7132853-Prymnesium_polylepis.1
MCFEHKCRRRREESADFHDSARISKLDADRLERCGCPVSASRRLRRRRVLDDETGADDRAARRGCRREREKRGAFCQKIFHGQTFTEQKKIGASSGQADTYGSYPVPNDKITFSRTSRNVANAKRRHVVRR